MCILIYKREREKGSGLNHGYADCYIDCSASTFFTHGGRERKRVLHYRYISRRMPAWDIYMCCQNLLP